MVPLLAVEGLSVKFGGLAAISDVTFAIGEGEMHGLIGANGAGKTTLFNAISGLASPSAGRIVFRGSDVTSLPAHERAALGIRRTFQAIQLVQSFTVYENLLVGLHRQVAYDIPRLVFGFSWRSVGADDSVRRVQHVLRYLEIEEIASREISSLTIAEQRLAEVAQALISRPKLVMFDEPAAGLTPLQVSRLEALLVRLRADWGITILLVEHVVSLVLNVCERITVLDRGRIIAQGAASDIKESPVVQAAYLGEAADA